MPAPWERSDLPCRQAGFTGFHVYGLSQPPLDQGLQRRILQMAFRDPFNIPYLSMAKYAYSEQVGRNLQTPGQGCIKEKGPGSGENVF